MDFGPNNWYQRPRSTLGEVRCAPVDPSLPPPWEEVFDVATGRFYYWNTVTNVTQFEKPAYPNPFQSFYPFPYPEPVTSVPPSSALFEPPHFSPPSLPTSHQTQPLALPIPVVHDLLNQIAAIQQTITDVSNTCDEALRQFQERRRRFQERRRQFQELRSQWPCRTTSPTVPSSAYSVHSNPNSSSTDVHNEVNLPLTHPHPTPQHHSSIPPASHHTQTKSLHRKPLKGVRHRVVMAATRRVVKKTRKSALLCGVAQYSRCKMNRIHGLWVVKATTSFFPEFDEELCQLSMGPTAMTDTSPPTATNPSLPPIFNVSEKHEVYLSVAVAEEASFTSPNCERNAAAVPNGTTHCVALAGASALDPELSNLNAALTTFQVISLDNATMLKNFNSCITRQSPPLIGEAYPTSLRSVETPFSVIRTPLECHSSSVVSVTGSLPFASLESVVFVETNSHKKETSGLSIVNWDWRYDKAGELLLVLRTHMVSPWDFGIHLMKADEFHGPIVLFGVTDVEGKGEVLLELTSGVNIDPVVSALATVCAATFDLCPTIVQQVNMKAEFYEQEFDTFSLQQMVTGTKPPERIFTPKFHLGVWKLTLKVPINPCHNIEFVYQLHGGFPLPFTVFIKDLTLGGFKKGKLGLSYYYRQIKPTANGEFLTASGSPHILDYVLKALLLEFQRHLNFEITGAILACDYCYWKFSMPLSVWFENIEWSDVQVLRADWPLTEWIAKLYADADHLFDNRSTTAMKLDNLLVVHGLAYATHSNDMTTLGGSEMIYRRLNTSQIVVGHAVYREILRKWFLPTGITDASLLQPFGQARYGFDVVTRRLVHDSHNQVGISHVGGMGPLHRLLDLLHASLRHNVDTGDNFSAPTNSEIIQKQQDGAFRVVQIISNRLTGTFVIVEDTTKGQVQVFAIFVEDAKFSSVIGCLILPAPDLVQLLTTSPGASLIHCPHKNAFILVFTSQFHCFLDEGIDFLQIISEFSSSSIGKNTSLLMSPSLAWGTTSHVLDSLNVILVYMLNCKKAAVDIIFLLAIVSVAWELFLPVKLVEKLMQPLIMEFPQHYIPKKELAPVGIWLPTPLLHDKVWVLILHGLIVIRAPVFLDNAFLLTELMFGCPSPITSSGAIDDRFVCHFVFHRVYSTGNLMKYLSASFLSCSEAHKIIMLASFPDVSWTWGFGRSLWPHILDLLTSNFSSPFVRKDASNLAEFLTIIHYASAFETALGEMQFISESEVKMSIRTTRRFTSVSVSSSSFAENIKAHFASRTPTTILERARYLFLCCDLANSEDDPRKQRHVGAANKTPANIDFPFLPEKCVGPKAATKLFKLVLQIVMVASIYLQWLLRLHLTITQTFQVQFKRVEWFLLKPPAALTSILY